jgi:hypothetical protein
LKHVEPELLNLSLPLHVVREEVARDLDVFAFEAEVRPEELHEESRHLGIRVRKADLIPVFRALGPVEHASRDVKRFPAFGELAALLLSEHTHVTADSRVDGSPFHVPVEGPCFECCPLVGGELDVSDPTADGRERGTDLFGDRLHRHTVLPSQLWCSGMPIRCHDRKQHTDCVGRVEQAGGENRTRVPRVET